MADTEEQEFEMKALEPDSPITLRTLIRSSQIYRAIALIKNRAEICAPTLLAALLFTSIPTATAETLGRLFFTPAQRAQLDYAHARNAPTEGGSSPFVTVNGIVQKQGGARTVWVNGVSQSAGNSGERNPAAQTISVPGKSRPVKLKVGDKILLDQPAPATQATPVE